MCLPAAAAAPLLLGAQVGSSVLGFIGEKQATDAHNKFQTSRYHATADSALRSYENQLRLGHKRITQEEARVSDESLKNSREADHSVGKARVHSSAAGVSGQTADELVSEFRMIEAENENALRTNLEWHRDQMGEEFIALQSGAASRINAATPQLKAGPSPLALALDIGGAFVGNQVRANNNLPDGSAPLNTFDAFVGLF